MKSKFLRLHLNDFVKGLILAIITGLITILTNELQAGSAIDAAFWKRICIASVIAFLSYLVKNLFTNNSDEFLKTDKP